MKKSIIVFIAFLCAVILAGCAGNPASPNTDESGNGFQEQHGEESGGHSSDAEENTVIFATDPVLFESSGYSLSLPGGCIDSVIVNPEAKLEESPEYTLFDVYYKPSYDAAKAEGYMGGKLFSIWQLNRAQYEQYLSEGDWINEYAFACDGSHYYILEEPADIQIGSPEEWEPYCEALEACCPAAMEALIQLRQHRTIPGTHLACIMFRHIARKSWPIQEVFPAIFRQSDENSDCATCAPGIVRYCLKSSGTIQRRHFLEQC